MTLLTPPWALAALTIWQEARGKSHALRVAVGEVIRNRMASGIHSDGTVPGTVLAAFQFSGENPRDPNRTPSFELDDADPLVADCVAAWQESEHSNLIRGATYYFSPGLGRAPSWASPSIAVETANIDGTRFFYLKKDGPVIRRDVGGVA